MYQKKRNLHKVNFELKTKLSIIETREKHLMNVFNKNYAYNAITKHFMLNEKSTK